MRSGCDLSSVLDFRISASYGTTEVLHEVAATIAPGEIVSLVGLSGSGKSTLALALLRLLRYRGGSVTGLEGTELTTLSESGMRAIRGRRIGYVPQSPGLSLNPRLRVETLLDETWRAHASRSANHRVLLESVQLPADTAFLRKRAGELSTGQGQRLLIALALMHGPALLLADEPTSALDAITQAGVLQLFGRINRERGTAILFISHDLLSVAGISHRVDILHEGRLVESGSPAAVFRTPQHPFTRQLVAAMPRLTLPD
jgi:peptide/nickel transport system ATP-binding protein